MSNSDRKAVSYYAVVTDRKRRRSSKSDAPEDRFIVFTINARWVGVVRYGKRGGIETGYRMIEHMRAKTSSQSSTVRTFYFWYSLLVFNLWVIANAMLGRGASWDGEPIMSQNTLGEVILNKISEGRPKQKPPPQHADQVTFGLTAYFTKSLYTHNLIKFYATYQTRGNPIFF